MCGTPWFMPLTSSYLSFFGPQAVLAHELGHLKCDHGLWLTVANVLASGTVRCEGLCFPAPALRLLMFGTMLRSPGTVPGTVPCR